MPVLKSRLTGTTYGIDDLSVDNKIIFNKESVRLDEGQSWKGCNTLLIQRCQRVRVPYSPQLDSKQDVSGQVNENGLEPCI